MFRKISDFTMVWKNETQATLKVMRSLTDASLACKVSPEGRTLGTLAWHVVVTLPEMMKAAGAPVVGPAYDSPAPAKAADIACEFERCANAIATGLPKAWNDAMLADRIPMYGEQWPRGGALFALIVHQAHHRGQMTVLMRQAGLAVPGVYGPSREEWAAMGRPALP